MLLFGHTVPYTLLWRRLCCAVCSGRHVVRLDRLVSVHCLVRRWHPVQITHMHTWSPWW